MDVDERGFLYFSPCIIDDKKKLNSICLRPKGAAFGPASFDFDFDFSHVPLTWRHTKERATSCSDTGLILVLLMPGQAHGKQVLESRDGYEVRRTAPYWK